MGIILSVVMFLLMAWFVITLIALGVKVKREITTKDDDYYRQRENGEKAIETLCGIFIFPVIIAGCAIFWIVILLVVL